MHAAEQCNACNITTATRAEICALRRSDWLLGIVGHITGAPNYSVPEFVCRLGARELRFKALHNPPASAKQRKLDFRTLVDSWFAYSIAQEGWTKERTLSVQWFNRNDLTKPALIAAMRRAAHFVSKSAVEIIEGRSPGKLVKDHAVPVKILEAELKELPVKTAANLEQHLLNRYRLGLITKEEHDRLDVAGLRFKLPPNHDPKDPFSRYKAVGICRA